MYSRVYVEITNICNLRCSFCHGHSRPLGQMTEGAFRRVLRQIVGKTEYLYYHLMGEPLLHPQLPDFLALADAAGFRSVITTNGTLLPQRGAAILAAGVHKVNISLHSFEKEEGLEEYLTQVARFAQMAVETGTLVSLRLWNRGCDQGRNDLALEILRRHFPDPWIANTRGYRIRDRLFLGWDDRFDWPDLAAHMGPEQVFCYGLRDHFAILCDGTVVPCCLDSDGILALGNVLTQPLEEILASPRAVAMVRGFENRTAAEELCRRCGFARRFG